jgi:4-hydroxy-tetrahydrodipicolinate synthase
VKELKGVIALPPTPLTKRGEIDVQGLKSLIDFEMANGCHGVGVLAAIGEGYLFSDEDMDTVVRTAVDHMNGRGPLHVGCATMGTDRAVALVKAAEDLGADSVLAFNPQGMRSYTIEETYRHFRALTDAVEIHVVPYARGGDPIPFEVIRRLVDEGRIKYMKYAFRSCSLLQKLDSEIGDRLFKFCGADSWTLRYLLLGCRGIMTATAAVLPKENVELLKLVQEGRVEEARRLWYEKFLTWNDSGFYENWQWAHKYALKLMGIIETDIVPPPQSIGADYHKEELKALLKYQGKI